MPGCPKHQAIEKDIAHLYERSWPSWTRGILIAVLAVLFALYGGLWLYGASTYVTHSERRVDRSELREVRRDVKKLVEGQARIEGLLNGREHHP